MRSRSGNSSRCLVGVMQRRRRQVSDLFRITVVVEGIHCDSHLYNDEGQASLEKEYNSIH